MVKSKSKGQEIPISLTEIQRTAPREIQLPSGPSKGLFEQNRRVNLGGAAEETRCFYKTYNRDNANHSPRYSDKFRQSTAGLFAKSSESSSRESFLKFTRSINESNKGANSNPFPSLSAKSAITNQSKNLAENSENLTKISENLTKKSEKIEKIAFGDKTANFSTTAKTDRRNSRIELSGKISNWTPRNVNKAIGKSVKSINSENFKSQNLSKNAVQNKTQNKVPFDGVQNASKNSTTENKFSFQNSSFAQKFAKKYNLTSKIDQKTTKFDRKSQKSSNFDQKTSNLSNFDINNNSKELKMPFSSLHNPTKKPTGPKPTTNLAETLMQKNQYRKSTQNSGNTLGKNQALAENLARSYSKNLTQTNQMSRKLPSQRKIRQPDDIVEHLSRQSKLKSEKEKAEALKMAAAKQKAAEAQQLRRLEELLQSRRESDIEFFGHFKNSNEAVDFALWQRGLKELLLEKEGGQFELPMKLLAVWGLRGGVIRLDAIAAVLQRSFNDDSIGENFFVDVLVLFQRFHGKKALKELISGIDSILIDTFGEKNSNSLKQKFAEKGIDLSTDTTDLSSALEMASKCPSDEFLNYLQKNFKPEQLKNEPLLASKSAFAVFDAYFKKFDFESRCAAVAENEEGFFKVGGISKAVKDFFDGHLPLLHFLSDLSLKHQSEILVAASLGWAEAGQQSEEAVQLLRLLNLLEIVSYAGFQEWRYSSLPSEARAAKRALSAATTDYLNGELEEALQAEFEDSEYSDEFSENL